jgi:lipocalin-like protein
MTRIIASFAAFLLFICFGAAGAQAQTAQDLVGTWTLASATIRSGEVKMDMFGPDPSGTLMFGRDGHYALIFLRRDLPKLTSNNRLSQTVEESRDITKGSIAHFGTYAVDETGKFLVLRIESSTFPNWAGAEQRRPFSLSGDELTYISPGSSGVATEIVLRRAK